MMTHLKLSVFLFNLRRNGVQPLQPFQRLMLRIFWGLLPPQVDVLETINVVAHVVVVGLLSHLASPQ